MNRPSVRLNGLPLQLCFIPVDKFASGKRFRTIREQDRSVSSVTPRFHVAPRRLFICRFVFFFRLLSCSLITELSFYLSFSVPPRAARCRPDEFECSDGGCVSQTARCDGRSDCRDRSDEHNCNGTFYVPLLFSFTMKKTETVHAKRKILTRPASIYIRFCRFYLPRRFFHFGRNFAVGAVLTPPMIFRSILRSDNVQRGSVQVSGRYLHQYRQEVQPERRLSQRGGREPVR